MKLIQNKNLIYSNVHLCMCTHGTEMHKLILIQEFNCLGFFFLFPDALDIYSEARIQFSIMKCKYFPSIHVAVKNIKASPSQGKKRKPRKPGDVCVHDVYACAVAV